ncbi:TPA: YSIRK-type signal peptide-containing protein [Streptococcus pyogenes]|uniref:YSIRK-type signal peptide-containing protein n=1 Tax=Streptococcus pyogenes TaxID=1314 RepID=UPI00064A3893|nr:YSIRK-type signal peptide-containing protein [Streptococcus pyogenes]HER4782574.1 YSIRK-type signal peptide-containing protein [Streptococcus pyogenes NGAS084]AKL63879.1 fibronectin-binding protein [Streptococcus pyogenes]AMA71189.1 fibronectin-binding protein [Streptococcus pyogenes]ATL57540.1 fibronectin-binding protein [Streptococcus pyogenes]AZZ63215.1 YSIRK-type signal peptide-containing protein [Streptococcus pyogenes]
MSKRNPNKHYSLRKLKTGTASVAVALTVLGTGLANTTDVKAETEHVDVVLSAKEANKVFEERKALEKQARDLGDTINHMSQTISEQSRKIAALKSEAELKNQQALEALNNKNEQIAKLTNENAQLKEAIEGYVQTIQNASREIAAKQQELAAAKSQLEAKNAEIEALKQQDASKTEEIAKLQSEAATLENLLGSAKRELTDLQAKLDTANTEKEKLQSQAAALEKQLEATKKELADLQAKLAATNQEKEKLEAEAKALKEQLAKQAEELAKLKADKASGAQKPDTKPGNKEVPTRPSQTRTNTNKAPMAQTKRQLPSTGEETTNPFFTAAAATVIASAGVLALKRKEEN